MPPTLAARWRTTSAPLSASRQAAGSVRSRSAERGTRTSAPSSSSIRTVGLPRKPAPPVTTTALPCQKALSGARPGTSVDLARELVVELGDVGVDHQLDQFAEA